MTHKLGIHNLVFTPDWNEANGRSAVDSAARLGFELFEVLMFDPEGFDAAMSRRIIRDAGLQPRLGMALSSGSDIASLDGAIAARGKALVGRSLELASELGAPAVSGIVYAAFNNYPAAPSAPQRQQVVDAMGGLDRRARELGVRLGLEPVNRYESYLVNTIDDAASIIESVGGKNLFIHLDTFHMNVEEGDIAQAIARNGAHIGYVHLAENHRGMLGSGSFDFQGLFRALLQIGYDGDLTIEMMAPSVLGPELAGGINIWRGQWTESERAAGEALAFVRAQLAAASAAAASWQPTES